MQGGAAIRPGIGTVDVRPRGIPAIIKRSGITHRSLSSARLRLSCPGLRKPIPARRHSFSGSLLMSRLSQRAGKNRLAVIAGLIAAIGIAWLLFAEQGVELIGEERVEATVVEVLLGEGTPAVGKPGGIAIVLVELPEGGRARVFAPRKNVSAGKSVTVTVKRYSDGSREVTAAGNAPQ